MRLITFAAAVAILVLCWLFGGEILQMIVGEAEKPELPSNFCILGTEDPRYLDFVLPYLNASWLGGNETNVVKKLAGCCVILLKDDEEGRYAGLSARRAIAEQVAKGAGLIVTQASALLVRNDPAVFGWSHGLENIIPAKPSREAQDAYESGAPLLSELEGVLFIEVADEATQDVNFTPGLREWSILNVEPTGEGEPIALIRTPSSQLAYQAVISHKRLPVYYFAFSATAAPDLTKGAVRAIEKKCAKPKPVANVSSVNETNSSK